MTEDKNKVPPTVKKGGMVSEEMFNIKETADKARKEMEKPDFMPTPEFLELFKVEKLHDIAVALESLVEIFKTASKGVVPVQVTPKIEQKPIIQSSPTPAQTISLPVQTKIDSGRLIQVKDSLKQFSDLGFDEETSAQFIKIKPTKRLENFGEVFGVIRTLGGIYVSAGKDSHFEVPKIIKPITQATPVPTPQPTTAPLPTPVPVATTSNTLQSKLDEVKTKLVDFTKLSIEDKGDNIIIKPTQFLGSENFAKIVSIVRGLGGEYVSAGKESHLKIPK
jgi:hypothetical protein